MKKFLLMLMVCAVLMTVVAPVTAFADTFVSSVEQDGDLDEVPDVDGTAPQTGEAFPVLPVAAAAVFATAAVMIFVVAGKKKSA